MKNFVVLGVIIMLAMLLGAGILAEDLFLGPMASTTESEPLEYKASVELEEKKESEDNRRYAGYTGYNVIKGKGDKE
ncbi:hypothetical protein AGMMS49579_16460 [Spirochaetia bacterium]|nr:hypothetical protein AGMMS49579_16460 [Spirochaetia bacterium]